jgi:hypothetical protein
MDGHVEFATGMAIKDDHCFITFGFQDNAAYLLKFPINILNLYVR